MTTMTIETSKLSKMYHGMQFTLHVWKASQVGKDTTPMLAISNGNRVVSARLARAEASKLLRDARRK
jgi:hypothetical protein